MASLKFLVDNLCANFTVDTITQLVKGRLAEQPCSVSDITRAIQQRDRSLDVKSAQSLAEAAVESLVQNGEAALRGEQVLPAGAVPA